MINSSTMAIFHSSLVKHFFGLFMLLNTNVIAKNACDFNVKVKQVLLNEGFHRNMTYGIVFGNEENNWMYRDCVVGIDQSLPQGVYAKADELAELQRMRRLKASTCKRVNIEAPAEDARPTWAYVIGRLLNNKAYLWLPVHARYHRPQPGGGTARNTIMPPKLFLRCPDQRLDQCGDQSVTPPVSMLCNGAPKGKCSVREIPYTVMTDTLVWDVPVGDYDHFYAVAFGTSLAVMSASMYLLRLIHEVRVYLKID